MAQRRQRRKSRAKIINGNFKPHVPEFAESTPGFLGVCHQCAFGQLNGQQVRRYGIFGNDLLDHGQGRAAQKLRGRDVDGNLGRGKPRVEPLRYLSCGCVGNPFAQPVDKAAFFCLWNKLAGKQHAIVRVLPAHQSLKPHHSPGIKLDLRLIVQNQLVFCNGAGQAAFNL